jgi:hypothetical protein
LLPGEPVCVASDGSNVQLERPFLVDVTGDGIRELWVVTPPHAEQPRRARGYTYDGLNEVLIFEGERPGDTFGFGDLDGDGRDDLVAATASTVEFYAGQSDGSLSETPEPITVDGPWAFTLADADADGDDDVFRLRSAPLRLELVANEGASFSSATSFVLPDGPPAGAEVELVSVHPLGDPERWVAEVRWPIDEINHDAMLLLVAVELDLSLSLMAATEPGEIVYIGSVDVDGDTEPEVLAQIDHGEGPSIVAYRLTVDGLEVQTVIDEGFGAALGDFEGAGTLQLFYRRSAPDLPVSRLWRIDEGTDAEVIGGDTWAFPSPYRAVDFEGDGVDEISAIGCDLGCYAALIKFVEC